MNRQRMYPSRLWSALYLSQRCAGYLRSSGFRDVPSLRISEKANLPSLQHDFRRYMPIRYYNILDKCCD